MILFVGWHKFNLFERNAVQFFFDHISSTGKLLIFPRSSDLYTLVKDGVCPRPALSKNLQRRNLKRWNRMVVWVSYQLNLGEVDHQAVEIWRRFLRRVRPRIVLSVSHHLKPHLLLVRRTQQNQAPTIWGKDLVYIGSLAISKVVLIFQVI